MQILQLIEILSYPKINKLTGKTQETLQNLSLK